MGKDEKKDTLEKDDVLDEKTTETQETKETESTEKEKVESKETSNDNLASTSEFEKMKQDYAILKDKHIRLLAEFDNFRKRTNREKLELTKTAAKETLTDLLPVLDDFDRAKKVHDDDATDEFFTEGVQLVYQKILTFMNKINLEAIESTGQDFDVETMEAITEIPAPNDEMKGKVIDTVERGYILKDKIIRYAKVVVGK